MTFVPATSRNTEIKENVNEIKKTRKSRSLAEKEQLKKLKKERVLENLRVADEFSRSSHVPDVDEDLFDEMNKASDFWGKFTNTGAENFAESVRLGAWRFAGTRQRKSMFDIETPNIRQMNEELRSSQAIDCPVTSSTLTEIQCDSSGLPAGNYVPVISVEGSGNAVLDASVKTMSSSAAIISISPLQGSIHGGALLTITGTGFVDGGTNVTINGEPCLIESITISQLQCRTPPQPAGSGNVKVIINSDTVTSSTSYNYQNEKSPHITNVS